MIAQDALAQWLIDNVPSARAVLTETPNEIPDDKLPGVLLLFDHIVPGEAADSTVEVEQYRVLLLPAVTGAPTDERQAKVYAMETEFLAAVEGSARFSLDASVEHVAAEQAGAFLQDGYTSYRLTAWALRP